MAKRTRRTVSKKGGGLNDFKDIWSLGKKAVGYIHSHSEAADARKAEAARSAAAASSNASVLRERARLDALKKQRAAQGLPPTAEYARHK